MENGSEASVILLPYELMASDLFSQSTLGQFRCILNGMLRIMNLDHL